MPPPVPPVSSKTIQEPEPTMRILTLGLGGAGCRIIDRLLVHDRQTPVRCVYGIAVDNDAGLLNSLQAVPPEQRLFFQPLDPSHSGDLVASLPSEEILAKLQAMDDGDIDAIVVCTGLGGSMAGTAASLVSHLKTSVSEPVFGLCTLPCLEEGDGRACAAADQVDELVSVLDGIIVFDNESWRERASSLAMDTDFVQPADIGSLIVRKSPVMPPLSGADRFFMGMDNHISRRISLLLRAGEYSERDPSELPQVVLDAGEILNTIQGMGFITIGYARDEIGGQAPFDILSRIRPGTPSVQDQHIKASRVVDLAKRAIFGEISAPTDLEKAQKALILIAGPSHEMSMKGFMSVRKWIDRTIGGMELRSGDYPVSGSRYLGIFVILAGMETLPAVEKIRQVRGRVRGGGQGSGPQSDPGKTTVGP